MLRQSLVFGVLATVAFVTDALAEKPNKESDMEIGHRHPSVALVTS